MTKYDIAQRIAAALGIDAALKRIDQPTDATPRPYDCHPGRIERARRGIDHATPFDTALRAVLRDAPQGL